MKFWALVGVLALVSLVAATDDHHWESHKQAHNLQFDCPHKHNKSKVIFLQNKNLINEHNQKYNANLVNYRLELNHLSHLSQEEMKTYLHGFAAHNAHIVKQINNNDYFDLNGQTFSVSTFSATNGFKAPREINWTKKCPNVPVRNQGMCNCCWAFSSVTAYQYNLCSQKQIQSDQLAPQQIIDCFSSTENGCNPSFPLLAIKYIERTPSSLALETNYPFFFNTNPPIPSKKSCKQNFGPSTNRIKSSVVVELNYDAVIEAVATLGPLVVAIDSTDFDFMHYRGPGIYTCKSGHVTHAVALVGYGTENGKDYWIIQNSYGSNNWGINGFMKMERTRSTQGAANCGMLSQNAMITTTIIS